MITEPLIYNIPVNLLGAFRGRKLIVRAHDPNTLMENLLESDLENLQYVQILTLGADVSALANWRPGLPIELVMYEPKAELAKLYNHAKLLDKHSVRVAVPVRRGFANAAKVAASLSLAVKIIVGQPGPEEIAELFEVLEMFLHRPAVTQPIEFYQSSMTSFFHDAAATIWEIQGEDPSRVRFITSYGTEIISPRFIDARPFRKRSLATFIEDFKVDLLAERRECESCEFLTHCSGYFKWPNRDYLCANGIKKLFGEIKKSARELRNDLEVYAAAKGEVQS